MNSRDLENQPKEYIPTVEDLKYDFQKIDDGHNPTLQAVGAKLIGLFLKYVMRKKVRWEPNFSEGDSE